MTPSGTLNVSVTVDERLGLVGTNHNLTATVTRTTNRTVNRTLVVTAGSEQIGSEKLTLPPNETQTVRTEWTPESHSSQPQRMDVSVGGISDTGVTEVVKPGTFEIRSVDANESVAAGESVAVTAEIENTGDVTTTQTVTVGFGGEVAQTESLTIENDDTAVVTFSVQPELTDAGIFPVTVASADTESRALVEITGGERERESTERETQTAADDDNDGAGSGVAASIAGIGASWYLFKRRGAGRAPTTPTRSRRHGGQYDARLSTDGRSPSVLAVETISILDRARIALCLSACPDNRRIYPDAKSAETRANP